MIFNGNQFLNNDFSQPIVTYNSFTNLGTNSDSIPNWIYYTDNLNDIVKISNDNTSVQNKQYLSVNTNYSYISQKILLNENIEYAITLYLKANEPSFSNSRKSQVIVKMNDDTIAIFEPTNIWQLYDFYFTTGYTGYYTFQFIFSNQSEQITFFTSSIFLYYLTNNSSSNIYINSIQNCNTTNYITDSSLCIDPNPNTIPLRDCKGDLYVNDLWISGAINFYDGVRIPCLDNIIDTNVNNATCNLQSQICCLESSLNSISNCINNQNTSISTSINCLENIVNQQSSTLTNIQSNINLLTSQINLEVEKMEFDYTKLIDEIEVKSLSNTIVKRDLSGSIYNNSSFLKESIYINSDNRSCQNITNIQNPINNLMSLRPVTYTSNNKIISGFIAQEIESIYPNIVKSGQFDDTIQDNLKSVSLLELIPYLVKCIQDQETRIKYLENLIGQ
jgi:hypothetical protein